MSIFRSVVYPSLRQLVEPSADVCDEDKRRRARLLTGVAYSTGAFLMLASVVAAIMATLRHGLGPLDAIAPNPDAPIRWWQVPIFVVSAVVLALGGAMARRGRDRTAAWFILASIDLFLVVAVLIFTSEATLAMGFAIPVLIATIVLDTRSTLFHGLIALGLAMATVIFKQVDSAQFGTTLGMLITMIILTTAFSLLRERDLETLVLLRGNERAEAERIQKDLQLARRVQLAMLPESLPSLEGVDIAAYSEPALEASGDFYDLFAVTDSSSGSSHLGIAVCDVAGKGIASALVMSATRASLRAAAVRHYSPAAVLAEVNATLASSIPPELFVTACYAIFDPESRVLLHSSAGHPHPMVWTPATKSVSELETFGLPLGLVEDAEYFDRRSDLEAGSCLAIYSDGLPEALNADRQMYGFDRTSVDFGIAAQHEESAEAQLQRILRSVRGFVGEVPFDDDLTLVVLK